MKSTLAGLAPLFLFSVAGTVVACGDDTPANGATTTATSAGTAGSGGTTAGSGGQSGSGGTAGTGGAGGGGTDDGGLGDGGPTTISKSNGTWTVYPDPYGDAGTANPIGSTIMGTAEAFAVEGGKMRLVLTVSGLPPNRPFGSHLHKLKCDDNKAGGHYQDMPFPDGGSATDPTFANPSNEAWLDFTTDGTGAGSAQTIVNWVPRAAQANAVIIHDMKTMDGGVAGARLACTNIPF